MAKQKTAGIKVTTTSHRRSSPAGNVVELSLADLVTAYNLDPAPASGRIEQWGLDALKGGDPSRGNVLLATMAAFAIPVLRSDGDGPRRVVYNAETIFALASFTPAESWAHTRVCCRVLSEAFVPGSTCEELAAIFQSLAGARTRNITGPARRALRRILLIPRERPCDVARSASVSARRKR